MKLGNVTVKAIKLSKVVAISLFSLFFIATGSKAQEDVIKIQNGKNREQLSGKGQIGVLELKKVIDSNPAYSSNDEMNSSKIIYDFDALDSLNSREDFIKKGYDSVMKSIVSYLSEKGTNTDDIQLLLENIVSDLEAGDSDAVKEALIDEGFDKGIINTILLPMKKLLPISDKIIDNLGVIDIDSAVDYYMKNGKIPKGYEGYKSYLDEIKSTIERGLKAKEEGLKAEKRGLKAEKRGLKAEKIYQQIKNIKEKMKNLPKK